MTAHARVPAHASRLPAWAVLCFFVSGAAGLLYEVVWSKQLSYLLGNSLQSVATVVAAFLAGLAIGARVLGVPLSRRGNGPRMYAMLEIGVGVLGLVLLPLLRGIDPLIGTLYRSMGGETTAFALVRFGVLFVLLLPPAALMGATLPVLVGHFERDWVGPALARLYALNTFGAVAGSILGGFALMPNLGLMGTTFVAAALNVAVALLAWNRQRAPGIAAEPAPKAARPAAAVLAPPARVTFAILFGLSGFAALAFQIAWVRLFSLNFGSSVYSFSGVLGIYLLGLALGSALVARFMKGTVTPSAFGRIQILLAVSTALMLHTFSRLPQWVFEAGTRAGADWTALFASELAVTAALLLVPCMLLGAAFPIAARVLQLGDGGHAAGFAYAVNTAGTIAGSLFAGFVAVPTWGVQGTHLGALLISLAIGLMCLLVLGRRSTADLVWVGIGTATVATFAYLAPRWDPALMSQGVYRPSQASQVTRLNAGSLSPTVATAGRTERVLFYREGINGSVYVGTDAVGENPAIWLRVSGKVDASTDDMETQVMLGALPAAIADSGARTLVIGLGSGITAAAALAAGVGKTDVVEIEPGVVEASHFFHAKGKDPLDDPRVTLYLGDARTHLMHGAGRYGLIISEPSNPWIAGVNNLFTVDFYRRVKSRLEPDGVFCQWMQLYELSPETFGSMVRSFVEVFPEGNVFAVWRNVDVLLVAMPPTRSISIQRLMSPAALEQLKLARIPSPEYLAAHYGGTLQQLRDVTPQVPLNTDDRPTVEYRAPRDMVTVGRTSMGGHPGVTSLVPFAEARPPGPLYAAWTDERWLEMRAEMLVRLGEFDRAKKIAEAARRAAPPELAQKLEQDVETGRNRRKSAELVALAQQYFEMGRTDEGRRALEESIRADSTNAAVWVMLADERFIQGDLPGSKQALVMAQRYAKDERVRAGAECVAGMHEMAARRPIVAAAHFREAQRLDPGLRKAFLYEARARADGGDSTGARDAARRGLAASPNDRELTLFLRSLGGS